MCDNCLHTRVGRAQTASVADELKFEQWPGGAQQLAIRVVGTEVEMSADDRVAEEMVAAYNAVDAAVTEVESYVSELDDLIDKIESVFDDSSIAAELRKVGENILTFAREARSAVT